MVTALVMAGGKGTRMNIPGEKPLIQINGKFMIDMVLQNLQGSQKIDKIYIITTVHTLKTQEHVIQKGYSVIKTNGEGYLEDLSYLLSLFESKDPEEVLLTINSDLPLVQGETIDDILGSYEKSDKPAMCVSVPLEIYEKYNLEPSVVLEGIVPSGVNILRSINKIQDEEVLEVPKIELALNINTCHDIKVFERLFGDNDGRSETD